MFSQARRAFCSVAAKTSVPRRRFWKIRVATGVIAVPTGGLWLYGKMSNPSKSELKEVPGAQLPTTPLQFGSYDVAVVGGGIIGLATANEILRRYPKMKVVILERESEVAAHQTGHNSGVIHAGIYYKPGTVMAKACVEGADLMYQYAEDKGIPFERVGKLICAPTEKQHHKVLELYDQGVQNGVRDLKVLTGAQVKEIEPNVEVFSALESPNTGIIDYGDVARSLAKDMKATGNGEILLRYQVEEFSVTDDPVRGMVVALRGVEPGQHGPSKVVHVKNVVTCAGVHMDHVARMGGGEAHPQVMSFRGRYYQTTPEYRNIVKRNVYPVPGGGGIPVGVHFTPTIGGYRQQQMIIGPGACMAFDKDGYSFLNVSLRYVAEFLSNEGFWRFGLSNIQLSLGELLKDANRAIFLREARMLVPTLRDDMVEDSFTGVMAQVFLPDGSAAKDYIFERKCLEGTTLHLRNAPSPAATSSMAIAKRLVDIAEEDFSWSAKSGKQ